MSKKLLAWLGTLLIISLSIFVFNTIYEGSLPKIVEEINNSSIGAILTAIVTVFLLQGQTANEEQRDKSLKVFEKKQEIYHEFLEKLKDILADGQVKISKGEDESNSIDELKELLFQLSYIQMHSNEENTKKIFFHVASLIKQMNSFSLAGEDKNKLISNFYASFADELFEIVSILKNDLYNISSNPIPKSSVEALLTQCDLFIEGENLNINEKHYLFWNELQNRLKSYGYSFEEMNVQHIVNQYYSKRQYVGLEIPIYTTKQNEVIKFKIELYSSYYYGVIRPEKDYSFQPLEDIIKNDFPLFKKSSWWFAWKYPDRYKLNFAKTDSPELDVFNHPQKRYIMMKTIADEIDTYIQEIIEKLKEQGI